MRLRKRQSEPAESDTTVAEEATSVPSEESSDIATPVRDEGPWDAADAPAAERADLGGLRLPQVEGIAWRADVDSTGGTVIAVSAVIGAGAVQLQPFAAPRTAGLWAEVVDEIEQGLAAEGATPKRVDGPFGVELHAVVTPGGGASTPAVFAGVDGPRWLLRLVYSGAAVDGEPRQRLDEVVRSVVVVRGSEPMAPRDLIGLRLPEGTTA